MDNVENDDATQYTKKIVAGEIVACKREVQACQRHLDDLEKQGTDKFPYVYDLTRVERIIDFFEKYCYHVKGLYAGRLIQLEDWQKFDLSMIFGWVDMYTGARRFTRTFQEVGRGNAKSTVMSGVAIYGSTADCMYPPYEPDKKQFEMSPEVECAAYDREQAKIVWSAAAQMALASPKIKKQLNVKATYIKNKKRGGHLRALSKDTRNKDGLSTCIAVADEIHAWRTSEVMDIIISGFGKRAQNLFCAITTAGNDAENSVGKKEYDICCKILDGIIVDESYFIIIRELDKGDNPYDSSTWGKANPILRSNSDYSKQLFKEINKAKNLAMYSGDPAKRREFLTKRCNLWQEGSEDKYFTAELMEKWKTLSISRDEFEELTYGLDCVTGLDLSKSIDLTGEGSVFILEDGRIGISAHGFVPESAADRHEKTDRIFYRQWADDGWCTLVEGDVIDDRAIVEHIVDTKEENKWNHREICLDPYSSRFISGLLQDEGFETVEIRQNFLSLSEATKLFRVLVMQGKIVHDGNPILTWCISNAYQMTDTNENIKLNKKTKNDTQRIDLIAAVINALVRLPELKSKRSVYDDRGIREI